MKKFIRCKRCGKLFYTRNGEDIEIKFRGRVIQIKSKDAVSVLCDKCGLLNTFRGEDA